MKVVLYAAASLDGFIAKDDGESDWVTDTGLFESTLEEASCYIVGRNTFQQFEGELYPIEGITNIVLSSTGFKTDLAQTVHTPEEALTYAESLGHTKTVIVGGTKTWRAFADKNLFDEIILDIEPVVLSTGMRLELPTDQTCFLDLIESQKHVSGVVHNVYRKKQA